MTEQLIDAPLDQDTDLAAPGGEAVLPFDEEAYAQKVATLSEVLAEQTELDVAAQRNALVTAVGGPGKVERTDVWSAIKKQAAHDDYTQIGNGLIAARDALTKPSDDRDAFDRVIVAVAVDHRGTTDLNRLQAGIDQVDFNAGGSLDALAGTDTLQDPAMLAKATDTIRLLVAEGQYKFHHWGSGDQLKTALGLMKTYTEWVPDFDPAAAGFDEARASLTMDLAALQVDQASKSNYQYAMPGRSHLMDTARTGLQMLNETEAHVFLRYNDLDLPDTAQAQPE